MGVPSSTWLRAGLSWPSAGAPYSSLTSDTKRGWQKGL